MTGYTLGQYLEAANVEITPEMPVNLPMKFEPREHQVSGLNLALYYDRCGIFDEQGTGKTLIMQALSLVEASLGNGTICLMPPTLLRQFEKKYYETFEGVHEVAGIARYQGTPKQRAKLIETWDAYGYPEIVLMTYDIFRQEGFMLFKDQPYFRVIADEATIFRDPSNKASTALKLFLGPVGEKSLLLATGTPARNTLADLYGYIYFITPGVYESKRHFYSLHVIVEIVGVSPKNPRGYEKIIGFQNTDLLWARLYAQSRRITKEEALDLPDKVIEDVEVELSPKHKKAYKKLVDERMLELDDGEIVDATNASALYQTCLQSLVDSKRIGVKTSAVLETTEELLKDCGIESGEKVLLFCHYRSSVKATAEALKKYNPAVIFGGTSPKEREKAIDRFTNDPDCKVMVANYVSGGVGIDGLQDFCRYIVCVEPTSVPGDFDQAMDRLHRNGQEHKVTIYVLRVPGTASVRRINEMRRKSTEITGVVSRDQLRAGLLGDS